MQKSAETAIAAVFGNLNAKPSSTCMAELAAFSGPLPSNHYVNLEKAKAAILHLQATDTHHSPEFAVALADAMRALNKVTPYL
jgi:hypothetical protein